MVSESLLPPLNSLVAWLPLRSKKPSALATSPISSWSLPVKITILRKMNSQTKAIVIDGHNKQTMGHSHENAVVVPSKPLYLNQPFLNHEVQATSSFISDATIISKQSTVVHRIVSRGQVSRRRGWFVCWYHPYASRSVATFISVKETQRRSRSSIWCLSYALRAVGLKEWAGTVTHLSYSVVPTLHVALRVTVSSWFVTRAPLLPAISSYPGCPLLIFSWQGAYAYPPIALMPALPCLQGLGVMNKMPNTIALAGL